MFAKWLFSRFRRAGAGAKRRPLLQLEELETRALLAVVTVSASQVIRQVNNDVLGVNAAWWDSNLNTAQTQSMVQNAGLTMFRFPGGSSSDAWHFNAPPLYSGAGTTPSMASFIASVGGTGLVTLNYGTGSPQEAAACLAYLNGSVGNTTVLGSGEEWNVGASAWVQFDWKTAGYWAGLRAATPLAQDDGLNFMRIGRAAPFGFHYYEVGNEIYGSWETDEHGVGGDTGVAHDPATYVAFAKKFATYAATIDPAISIGEVTGSISYDNNWTPNVLHQDAVQGLTPGFLSDHIYVQAPGSESDANLLLNTVSSTSAGGSGSPDNWPQRALGYRAILNQYLGAGANNVELLATEFNSVYSNTGKQTTSLVNGLFVADSLGLLLQTEYNAADVWDLRNGWDTTNNNSSSLYGWRQGGDYGLLGGGAGTSPPATGTYVPYPTYFAEQLLSKMVHPGDTVVQAASNDANLDVFAVKQAGGHLDLLVINKSATSNLSGQFQVTSFTPSPQAQLWQYGKVQDTAQSQTTDGHSALLNSPVSLSLSGSSFSYIFPSYSMTVLDLAAITPTTTTVTASAASAIYGQVVTFTATVTASGGTPTGGVEFYDQTTGADLGAGSPQSSGPGTVTWYHPTSPTQLKVTGPSADAITAVYNATGAFSGSSGTLPSGEQITPAPLTITATTNNKPYDGSTSAAALPTVIGLQGTDKVTGLAEAYTDPSPGTAKTLIVTAYTVSDGSGGTNYTVSTVSNMTGVITGPATYFTITVPTIATTGSPFNVTLTAMDRFNNVATGYTGTVSIASTDPAASTLVPSYTFLPGDHGVYTFSVTLNTSTLSSGIGTTIFARDTTATTPPINGVSVPVPVQGLVVIGTPQPTPTGFTVTFSKPFVPADLTMYGFNTTTVQDVTMVGAANGNIPGTLILDPANPNQITFKATNAFLEALDLSNGNRGNGDTDSIALPDDAYTVTLVSGSGTNGFVDALNSHLDGLANGMAANKTFTFATTFQDDAHANANPAQVLGIPDFARGPDGATTIKVSNNTAQGIPIALYNSVNVQDATFTLTYNPAVLTVSGGGTGDSPAGSTFTIGAVTANTAVFTYHNAAAHSGTVILGDILASVPNSAAGIYKTKELLTLSGISVTGGATVQAANGIHVDAYVGDVHVTAAPAIDASDALDALKVASGAVTGFSAYTLLDPAIIGNFIAGHLSVDPASVTALFTRAAHLPAPQLPNIPAAVTSVSVSGADPTLSLLGGVQPNGIASVQVMLDHPHPVGSTGMTEAHLALTYDPSALSLSARDITLGSIPGLGAGWRIISEVDAATGQIGITLYNLNRTPITATQAGSLVNIAFHVVPDAAARWAAVQLVNQTTPNGLRFVTEVDDDQGPMVLSPGVDQLEASVKLGPRTRYALQARNKGQRT